MSKKVLIVDDEEAIINMYKAALSDYEVLSAKNGEDALKIAKEKKPDLIYLDIIMPIYNGLDVLSDIKQDNNISHIPVILLTNLPEEASADKAKSLGAVDYFVKAEFEPERVAEKTKEFFSKAHPVTNNTFSIKHK